MKKISTIIIVSVVLLIIFACEKDKTTQNKKAKWIENAFVSLQSNNYPSRILLLE